MKKKNLGGAPTKMTPEVIQKLEMAFANGATDLQACHFANISKSTLYNYQNENPEFLERKEGLKQDLQLIAKNNLAEEIRNGNVDKSQWLLERKEKDEYSTKQTTNNEHSGDINISITKRIKNARDTD